ncbi:MAG TPA: hypothetical protein VFP49_13590 [Nitrososphaeraceae archaeon]|nr:hypothetical protein [Nitrososphaeraceae archaeon]
MKKYRNYSRSGNNSLLMRLLAYASTTFIIPFVINMVRNKLNDQQRLLCDKCHGKLEVIDKGNFYCKSCKIIKFDS